MDRIRSRFPNLGELRDIELNLLASDLAQRKREGINEEGFSELLGTLEKEMNPEMYRQLTSRLNAFPNARPENLSPEYAKMRDRTYNHIGV